MAEYVKKAGRKAQKGGDPNDRRYDWDYQQKLKRMNAADVDKLMRNDEDDSL